MVYHERELSHAFMSIGTENSGIVVLTTTGNAEFTALRKQHLSDKFITKCMRLFPSS